MRKAALPLAAIIALGLSACSAVPNNKINYVPPSAARVSQSVDSATAHSGRLSASLAAAAAKAKTATDRIEVLEKAVEATPPILTLAQQVHGDLDDLTKLLFDSNAENEELKKDLGGAVKAIADLQVEVGQQTAQLNQANANLNAAITQGAIDKRNAHKFKWIIIGLAVAATGLLVFGIFGAGSFAPPLLYVLLGAPSAVGTFLFFWLGSG